MSISPGARLPAASLIEIGPEGPRAVASDALFAGRRVVAFAVPGAFTGTCTTAHVPSFVRTADAIRARGVDEIVCIAVNDPFVLAAWSEATGAKAAGIRMLADASGAFTRAIGMAFDRPEAGLHGRSKRYAMLVEDGVVSALNVEENTRECGISAGETLLRAL
jgi:glutaredoxin/glutathione-dependent peroxiredoxin